jgi:acetylornithine deacetylase/succinyl-diaminopimelate desuccinylase-like protein
MISLSEVTGMGIDAKEKVLELIDQRKGSIIEFLQKLVSFPSVSGDEWVNIDDVITATKTLSLTIMDWCGSEL